MKRTTKAIATIALCALFAAPVLAANTTAMAPLQDALWAGCPVGQLRALAANPNTKPETIQSLIKELTDLRAQVRTKQDAFRAKVKSELGITLPYGMGGRGMGRKMGRGCGMMGNCGMMGGGPAN
jgi:hypothetical protein